jgi:peptidoglycan/xylan/chitin deacetylase (PgdA/CDA1 family)
MVRLGVVPASVTDPAAPLDREQVEALISRLRAPRPRPAPPDRTSGARLRLPLLVLHQIHEVAPGGHGWSTSLAPRRLEALLEHIADHGVETLTFRDLAAIEEGRRPAPARGVVLGFDDGYRSQVLHALPLLDRFGMKGSFAVVTSTLSTGPRHMTREQVRALAAEGHEICSHTLTHPNLARLPEAAIRRELEASRAELEELLLRPVDCLVYPYGRYDARVVRLAREAGYRYARGIEGGPVLDLRRPHVLPALAVPPAAGPALFHRWFATSPGELLAARGTAPGAGARRAARMQGDGSRIP